MRASPITLLLALALNGALTMPGSHGGHRNIARSLAADADTLAISRDPTRWETAIGPRSIFDSLHQGRSRVQARAAVGVIAHEMSFKIKARAPSKSKSKSGGSSGGSSSKSDSSGGKKKDGVGKKISDFFKKKFKPKKYKEDKKKEEEDVNYNSRTCTELDQRALKCCPHDTTQEILAPALPPNCDPKSAVVQSK